MSKQNTPSNYKRLAYIESYMESWSSGIDLAMLDALAVDRINVAFINIDTQFQVTGLSCTTEELQALVKAGHERGIAIKIALGGATYPLSPILTSEENALKISNALCQYVKDNNLDGIDLDIEDYPASQYQIKLIECLRAGLDQLTDQEEKKLLTYTPKAPASTTLPYSQVIQGAWKYLDGINIMAYDAGASYRYQDDINGLLAMGVPAEIITIGLMPGKDDMGTPTDLDSIKKACQFVLDPSTTDKKPLLGVMTWDMNRDYHDLDGLGPCKAIETAAGILHEPSLATSPSI